MGIAICCLIIASFSPLLKNIVPIKKGKKAKNGIKWSKSVFLKILPGNYGAFAITFYSDGSYSDVLIFSTKLPTLSIP